MEDNKKEVIIDGKKRLVDGFIDTIRIYNKTYALQCAVVEVYPISCPKCGGSFELKYGSGKCPYCNTNFTTQFKLVEIY